MSSRTKWRPPVPGKWTAYQNRRAGNFGAPKVRESNELPREPRESFQWATGPWQRALFQRAGDFCLTTSHEEPSRVWLFAQFLYYFTVFQLGSHQRQKGAASAAGGVRTLQTFDQRPPPDSPAPPALQLYPARPQIAAPEERPPGHKAPRSGTWRDLTNIRGPLVGLSQVTPTLPNLEAPKIPPEDGHLPWELTWPNACPSCAFDTPTDRIL